MIWAWMVWAVAVTGLLGLAAHFAEGVLRDRGWPTRWAWLTALAGSLVLQVWALVRPAPAAEAVGAGDGRWTVVDPAWLTEMGATAAAAAPSLGDRLDGVLTLVWIVAGASATLALLGGLATLRARAGRWHRTRIEGESVLLSGSFGPALVGVLSPEIVIPRWALRLPPEDLRLACLHEAEHRAARDTVLLLGAALAATLMPWNVALWWHARRLRAAVEVDCDARVLRRGASKRAYGKLLLELGSAWGRSPLTVLALARSESLLERRLKMIVRNVGERKPLKSLAAASVSAVLLVVACETAPPTTVDEESPATFQAAEIAEQSYDEPEASAGIVSLLRPRLDLDGGLLDSGVRFFVDGEEQAGVPEGLDATSIDRVEVRKDTEGDPSAVYVFTKEGEPARGTIRLREQAPDQPLIYVDDVRVEGGVSDLDLEPEDIERVEIVKGAAATGIYGPEASAGVIHITTKEGAVVRK